MDKNFLNLLFNYKGEVNYRQMQAATVMFFIILGYTFYPIMNDLLTNIFVGRMGPEWFASYTWYSRATSPFVPNLIPAWFIASYSTFIVAYKRVRTLNRSKALAIFSGISIYLLFASITSSAILGGMFESYGFIGENTILKIVHVLPYIDGAFLVIGVINMVRLCMPNTTEGRVDFIKQDGKLGVFSYIMNLGRIMIFFSIASIVIGFGLVLTSLAEKSPLLIYILSALVFLGVLFFYLRFSVYRLRDAEVTVYRLTIVVAVYFLLAIFRSVLIVLNSDFFVFFDSLFQIVTSFVMAFQFLLFLLPSKEK
jgi:hypothetical protein